MKYVFSVFLSVLSFSVGASALMEGERVAESVAYEDGARVAALCSGERECHIKINLNGEEYVLNGGNLPADVEIIPNGLMLTYERGNRSSDLYSVIFETVCEQYAKRPPAYSCIAAVIMKGKNVKSVSITKRMQSDEVIRRY